MPICEVNNISLLPQVIFSPGCFGTVHKVVPEGCVCVLNVQVESFQNKSTVRASKSSTNMKILM